MMTVATGTLTINAAFLQEIKEDNRRFRELLDETLDLVSDASANVSPRTVVETLAALRDQLALHFSLEEAFGYFEDALEAAPRLSAQAEELRSQHGQLFLELCEIIEQAEQWMYRETSRDHLPIISQRYSHFHRKVREHEARETELIMEAFDDDVGVGD